MNTYRISTELLLGHFYGNDYIYFMGFIQDNGAYEMQILGPSILEI